MKLNSITYKNRNTLIEDWQNYSCCDSNAMGNILTQERHNRSGVKFDDLSYKYQKDGNGNLQRNRLYHVNDAIASNLDSTDIDDMGAFVSAVNQINTDNNYSYDAEGRLVKDKQEEIDTILWTVTGKVREIHRIDTSKKKNLVFDYDAFGRRIAKHIYSNETSMLEKSTYYILDASGNQLSIYEHKIDTANNAAVYYLMERNIYGSSRLGVVNDTVNLFVPTLLPSYGIVGNRTYEFSNHLGNVLTVINDIKYPVSDDNVSISGFEVGIAGISDYSPFGAPLDGRTIQNSNYRYQFMSNEADNEISGNGNSYDFGARMHNPRIGRFFALDPRMKEFPFMSPYVFAGNNPIRFVDVNGEGPGDRVKKAKSFVGTPYKQQYEWANGKRTGLRTGTDEEALQYLDCSELVARVIAADGLTSGIKSMSTSELVTLFSDKSKWHKSDQPQVGDVFLWRTSEGGHTGIVTGVDENGKIEITHAANTKRGTVIDKNLSLSYFTNQTGWKGFFRPTSESEDTQDTETTIDNGVVPSNQNLETEIFKLGIYKENLQYGIDNNFGEGTIEMFQKQVDAQQEVVNKIQNANNE